MQQFVNVSMWNLNTLFKDLTPGFPTQPKCTRVPNDESAVRPYCTILWLGCFPYCAFCATTDFPICWLFQQAYLRRSFQLLNVLFIHRVEQQIDGEEWPASRWTAPSPCQGSPSVSCLCPWRISTNVSSVSWSWGSPSRLSAATASVYTASGSSPGRLDVLRTPTAVWNAPPPPSETPPP